MLTADLNSCCFDVAVITEAHFKAEHTAIATDIPGLHLICVCPGKTGVVGKAVAWQSTMQSGCSQQ